MQQNQAALEGAQLRLFVWVPVAGGVTYFWGDFITGHPLADMAVVGGIYYFAAQKHAAQTEGGTVFHPEVLRNVASDTWGFACRRASDMQAMSVAAQTCSPGMFSERAHFIARHAITAGTGVAAAAGNNEPSNSLPNNKTV